MSFAAYLKCIEFDLIVECFYNNRFFDEFLGLLAFLGLPVSSYLDEVFALRDQFPDSLGKIFSELVQARQTELWDDRSELIRHYESKSDASSNISVNEHKASLATAKSVVVFQHSEDLNSVAYQAMVNYLKHSGNDDENLLKYLEEASINSLMRKQRLLDREVVERKMHYDFVNLEKSKFTENPSDYFIPSGINISYRPNDELLSRNTYYQEVEPSDIVRWRKLMYEKRIDENSGLCRQMEITQPSTESGPFAHNQS
jgi:hypothetical protein